MKRTKKLESTAYHEAGHAVVTIAHNVRVHSVSIIPDPDEESLGHIKHSNPLRGIDFEWDNSIRARDRGEKLVEICMAGPIAQKRYNPKGYRHYNASSDHEEALNVLYKMSGSKEEIEAWWKLLEVRTGALVNLKWREIEHIAEALLDRHTLTAQEIKHLYYEAFDSYLARRRGT